VLVAGPAEAQNAPVTDDQFPEDGLPGDESVERLAGVCRLWGVVEYFHPALAYRDVDWDAALVEALPAVAAAGSPEAYREAVDRLLGRLGDPVTRTLPPEGSGGGTGAGGAPAEDGATAQLAVHRAGGVAVVVATDYDRLAAPAGGASLHRLLEEAADAEYVALTQLQADAFITLDAELARSVQGLVQIAPIEAMS
jgi:hypothetical protein